VNVVNAENAVNLEIGSRRHSEVPSMPASKGEKEEAEPTMHLKILLPYWVFLDEDGIRHIMVVTRAGAFGLLPRRLDCTAAVAPGILTYRVNERAEVLLAIDEGVLVKTGLEVVISVRNAIGERDLGKLRAAVEQQFLNLDERERSVRTLVAKVESDFVRRFLEMQHG
jgi:F-type H+-transporting ATPase subunit epsilon